jgi:hypothetical protein
MPFDTQVSYILYWNCASLIVGNYAASSVKGTKQNPLKFYNITNLLILKFESV